MNQDEQYTAQIVGVFLAETVKNVAKGSANLLYKNFDLLFYSEITELGLNNTSESDFVAKQLEANPKILETVRQKLSAYPELAEEMEKLVQKNNELSQRNITSQIYNEKVEISSINQSGGQTANTITNITNPLPVLPKIILTPKISFRREYIQGSNYEHYNWLIKLSNDGDKPVRGFTVEIIFPNIFTNQHTNYWVEVKERRTEEYRVFRTTSESHQIPVIYPSDEYLVFSGDYLLNDEMREKGELERKVYITIYSGDDVVCRVEKHMSELVDN